MRRVLFVSYWVPPRSAIGTLRSAHLLKHLQKFGWDVTVVTAGFDESDDGPKFGNYIETRYLDVKSVAKRVFRLGSFGTSVESSESQNTHISKCSTTRGTLQNLLLATADLVMYRDEHVGWLPFAAQTINKAIKGDSWDAVLSSGPPMTANVAAALSRHAVPWIADLRDLWAEDDSTDRSRLQKLFDNKFERAILSGAAALTASSELSAARFRNRYPGKPCFSISTGFDAEEWTTVEFGNEPQCTLLYAGTLYRGKRDPSTLFAAVREIFDNGLAQHDELRVDFYTAREQWLLDLIAGFGLDDIVRVHGFQTRDGILAAERRADRLIVLSWDGPTAEGVVAGKLFEYFGARRPVLAIGGPSTSAVEELLEKTGAGVRCRTVEQTKTEVLNALREHRSGDQRMIGEQAVRAYSGEACAHRFAEVLNSVASPVGANGFR